MSACGWVGKPERGATRSSLITRSDRKWTWSGSRYSPKEKVWRLSSQPISVTPRSPLRRTRTITRLRSDFADPDAASSERREVLVGRHALVGGPDAGRSDLLPDLHLGGHG